VEKRRTDVSPHDVQEDGRRKDGRKTLHNPEFWQLYVCTTLNLRRLYEEYSVQLID